MNELVPTNQTMNRIDIDTKAITPTQKTIKRLLQNRTAMMGLFGVVFFIFLAIFAPIIAPYEIDIIDLGVTLESPSAQHLFGTDHLGRDVLSRIIFGTRISLMVGVVSVGIACVVGIPLGLIAGYVGGIVDSIIVLVLDVLLAFPTILLALLAVSVLGPDLQNSMIAVGISSMPIFAKLARGSALSVKQNDFILVAISLGQRVPRIIWEHILPNSLAPLIVQATLRIGTAILTMATLSFLGLGAPPPIPEWGTLVSDGRAFLQLAPHISLFPGLAIMLCILAFSLFGDGLNDALNPRISRDPK
jgi:ABC-type dipeptide/oligopeptide/nickel transport system permease subunit